MNDAELKGVRDKLRNRLKESEGLRLNLYKCPAGKLTIGWGHNVEDKGINRHTADFILEEDINDSYHDLIHAFPWVLGRDPRVLQVLWDMCFNMGIGSESSKRGLRSFKVTLKQIEDGQYSKASKNMLQSKWAKDVGKRAVELSNLLASVPDGV
jgi:lysozyme